MRHLLVISTSFPDAGYAPGQEAAGMFVDDFVQELAHRVRVTAVVPGQGDSILSASPNLTIRRFAVPSLPLSLLKPTRPMDWGGIVRTMRAGDRAVVSAIQADPPDHILALWALPSGYWAQKRGLPYSVWALGSDIWGLGRVPGVRGVLRRVLRGAAHCLADGCQLAEEVRAISGRDCRFLPSSRRLPVIAGRRPAYNPPYKLAFLGRWHPNKGVDLLADSLSLLTDEDWRRIAGVRIFGGGPLAKMLKAAVESLREKGRPVKLGGYLKREEAADLLTWADYLLLPSRIESIPVIFSDALQAGRPLIATPVGDLPRLMADGGVGVLAEAVSATGYTRAVRRALAVSPDSFSAGLATMLVRFDIQRTATQLVEQIL